MAKSNSGPVFSADRLRSFVERIERLEDERKGIGGDIRDVYSEAKGVGYDVKIMRKVVQLRKMDAADRDEQEQLLDTYWHALSTVDRIEARAAAGESTREIAAAENVSKSTVHRVSQKARSQNASTETGHAPDSQEDSVLSGRGERSDEISKSCGGVESRHAETTYSLECGGGAAREAMPASEEAVPASVGRALDAGGVIPPRSNPALSSATGRNGDTAGVAPGPQDPTTSSEQEAPAALEGEDDNPIPSFLRRNGVATAQTPTHPDERAERAT